MFYGLNNYSKQFIKYLLILNIIGNFACYASHNMQNNHLNLNLTQILEIASTKSILSVENKLTNEIKELNLESSLYSYLPRASIYSQMHYSNLDKYEDIKDTFNATLSIYWDIFNFHKFLFRDKIRSKQRRVMEIQNKLVLQKAILQALNYYCNYLKQKFLLDVNLDEMTILEKNYNDLTFIFNKGLISQNELDNNKKKYLDAKLKYTMTQTNYKFAKDNLVNFLMIDDQKVIISDFPDLSIPNIPEKDELENNIINKSYILKSIKKEIELRKTEIKLSKYKFLSDFNTSFYASNSLSLDDWDWERDKEGYIYGVGVSWKLPVFNAGENKRYKLRSRIFLKQSELKFKKAIDQIKKEFLLLLEKVNNLKKDLDLKKNELKLEQENYNYLYKQFNKGNISKREFNEANLKLKKKKQEYYNYYYDYIISRLEIDYLSGSDGLWLTEFNT